MNGLKRKINNNCSTSDKNLFKYLNKFSGSPTASVINPDTGEHVFDCNRQHDIMIKQWMKIFNMHQENPPDWEEFKRLYGHFELGSKCIECDPPTAEALHNRAKGAKEEVSAGLDGWKTYELRHLPREAWEIRAQILKLFMETESYPDAYYQVATPCIPKKDQGNAPLDHRMLAFFSALYRIESGAWYDQLLPWLTRVLHPSVIGALPGREAAEIAWDAQAFLEHAMLHGLEGALSTYDFKKYFDSFDYNFAREMLIHAGFPVALANTTCNLYSNLQRR